MAALCPVRRTPRLLEARAAAAASGAGRRERLRFSFQYFKHLSSAEYAASRFSAKRADEVGVGSAVSQTTGGKGNRPRSLSVAPPPFARPPLPAFSLARYNSRIYIISARHGFDFII